MSRAFKKPVAIVSWAEFSTPMEPARNEIELLWLTGELRLQKPTVPQEVFWGLHFFNETLFEAVPDLLDKVERTLNQHYPGERWVVPPFFQRQENSLSPKAPIWNRSSPSSRRTTPALSAGSTLLRVMRRSSPVRLTTSW